VTKSKAEILVEDLSYQQYYPENHPRAITIDDESGLRKYSLKAVQVLGTILGEGAIPRLLVDGQEIHCKSTGDDFLVIGNHCSVHIIVSRKS
jgi:hypothetical protein